MNEISPLTYDDLDGFISSRPGETKLGERIYTLGEFSDNALTMANRSGVRFAILGIPEDIGPRANHGRGGAAGAWYSFLSYFLNIQNNEYLEGNLIAAAGTVNCADLVRESKKCSEKGAMEKLRSLCAELDDLVFPIIESIVKSGLIPIIIGGGHNNSFPIIKGCSKCKGKISVINCDSHADYRALEGRHSGNGFSYAHECGLMDKYFVLGMQESYNSAKMLERMKRAAVGFTTYEDIYVRREISFEQAVDKAVNFMNGDCGIELDTDVISDMPSSAMGRPGLSAEDAAYFLYKAAEKLPICYLHLPEAAPGLEAANGERTVGKTLSLLVASFIKGFLRSQKSKSFSKELC